MTDYLVYTFYGLFTLTKEIADEEELLDEFGIIPNGYFEDRERYMKSVKITRNNRKRLIEEEKDLPFNLTVPGFENMSEDVQKRFRYEWSERSW